MCIGDELARMLLLLFSASILQQFNITLQNKNLDLNGECGITLTPPSHELIFIKRSKRTILKK